MAEIHDQLVLDISQALREIQELQRALERALRSQTVDIDLGSLDSDLRAAAGSAAEIATEMRRVDSETSDAAGAARLLDSSLDQAEDEARDLARGIDRGTDEMRQFARAADSAGGKIDQVRGRVGGLVAGIGVGLVAKQTLDFLGESVGLASDLAESTSKAQVVFGQFAGEIERFADAAPQALGLTNAEALEMAGTFGNLFLTVGLTQDAAAGMSTELVQLGADLASFNNIEVGDALDKLRAGLAGEAEPLRALGVFLSESAVQAKALELGMGGASGAISEAEKVQARYALILEQTTTAQGDFARTADGIANSLRILRAEFDQAKIEIGTALAPAFQEILAAVPPVIDAIKELTPVFEAAARAAATAAPEVVGFVGDAAQALSTLFASGGDTQLNIALNQVVEQLKLGVDPATALANALAGLSRRRPGIGFNAEQLAALATTAGASPRQIQLAAQAVLDLGEAQGVGRGDVEALTAVIAEQRDILQTASYEALAQSGLDYVDTLSRLGEEQQRANEAVLNSENAFLILTTAADEAGISLTDLKDRAAEFGPEVQAAFESLDPEQLHIADMRFQLEQFAERLKTQVAPDVLEALDIIKGASDDIGLSARDIARNVAEGIDELANIDANLLIIATVAPRLAKSLENQGPQVKGAVADFAANLTLAAEVEKQLEQQESPLSDSFIDTVTTAIRDADLETLTSDEFGAIVEGIEDPTLFAQVQRALDQRIAALKLDAFRQAGIDAGLGYAAGLVSPEVLAALDRAGSRLVIRSIDTINRVQAADSPSKLFMEAGENAGLGFAIGLENSLPPNLGLPALGRPAITSFRPPTVDQSRSQSISVDVAINNPTSVDLETERVRLAQTTGAIAELLAGRII